MAKHSVKIPDTGDPNLFKRGRNTLWARKHGSPEGLGSSENCWDCINVLFFLLWTMNWNIWRRKNNDILIFLKLMRVVSKKSSCRTSYNNSRLCRKFFQKTHQKFPESLKKNLIAWKYLGGQKLSYFLEIWSISGKSIE